MHGGKVETTPIRPRRSRRSLADQPWTPGHEQGYFSDGSRWRRAFRHL